MSATHIRDLLLGRIGAPLDPRGIRLVGARITGHLDLTDVRSTVPLQLENCLFDERVDLDRAQLSSLSLRGSVLPALHADRLHLSHSLDLADLTATGHDENGAVRLLGSHITGGLDLTGATLTNETGPAFAADGLQVGSNTWMTDLRATGYGDNGAVRLPDAHITGQLELRGASLANETGSALVADGLQVSGSASLADLRASGSGDDGAVRLMGAHITGQLLLDGDATLINETGPALVADRMYVGSSASLADLRATGSGDKGAVRLPEAHIAGQLNFMGASLANETGAALYADRMYVGSETLLIDLTASGDDEDGVVRLRAHITSGLSVSGSMANGDPGRLILDLCDSKVDGQLFLWDETFWHEVFALSETDRPRLLIDGFIYSAYPQWLESETWLQVLQKCMPRYTPQPYRQMAEVSRGSGDEERAKTVLIAQQKAFGATLGHVAHWRGAKAWHWIAGATVRYGYRPGRALWFLLAVLGLSCIVMLFADLFGLVAHPKARGGGRCGVVETIGSAFDRTVPLLGSAAVGRCELTNTLPAQWIFVVSLILQAFSWAFITLFVVGFTGIVRKPGA
ncbi:hypothetical protein [Streptomyces sp. 8N706]|uniref:hypothetical protein n=1 Tax=Streptomyces sp. 8N706 TaxID=3457416 RepID=UPI003FD37B64